MECPPAESDTTTSRPPSPKSSGSPAKRVEADRRVAFRSHFDIDAFYCQPGITGAYAKGGVEGDIGRFRRYHLVPVPEVDSLRELNEYVD